MTRMLGPSGSKRRRRSLLGAIGAFLLLVVVLVPSAQAVLPGSPSNMESGNDPTLGLGNMVVDTIGNNDWATVDFTHISDAAASTSDDSFTSGQKQDTTCPTIEGHKNPPKDDFTDVASFTEVNATTGDTYLYGATIRYAANGNASENIELKQGLNGDCTPGFVARSAGDKLIAIDYLGGGSAVQFHVLTWVITGPCNVGSHTAPCWGATVQELDPNEAEGGVNNVNISAANNPISDVNIVAGQFAEFGINLTDSDIIPPGSCKSFTQTVWESRASGSSFVSTTKDIAIEDQDINSCASVSVRKVGSDGGSQQGVIFTLYEGSDITGSVVGTCTVDANGDCVDGNGDNPFVDLTPGTYTLDETNTPAGYTKDPDLPFTFTLAIGDSLELEFTNVLQNGAIVIEKTAKHADPNSSPNLVAGFTITDVDGGTHSATTDTDGAACVDGIPPGDATVSETDPPDGYSGGADQVVTVVGGTTCTNADGVIASFENVPLTDLSVTVDSQVDGGTSSTVSCTPDGPSGTTEANGDGTFSDTDLVPGTYTCVVVIDP
jgi:Prealbumin-like fold domain